MALHWMLSALARQTQGSRSTRNLSFRWRRTDLLPELGYDGSLLGDGCALRLAVESMPTATLSRMLDDMHDGSLDDDEPIDATANGACHLHVF